MPPEMPDVVTGNTIASEWGNDIRDRTIQRYADAAQRTTEHATPAQGDLSFLEDTGDVDVYASGGWQHIGPPAGAIQMWGAVSPPAGWLLCNGQAISRTTYAALFAAYGTTWGAGDGSTTFNLPDLRGRVPRGVAAAGDGDAVGETFGSDNHTHNQTGHTHALSNGSVSTAAGHTHGGSTGSSGTHNHSGATGVASNNHGTEIGLDTSPLPEHTHSVSSDGSHNHSVSTSSDGSHNHTLGGNTTDGAAGGGANDPTAAPNSYPVAAAALNFIIKT